MTLVNLEKIIYVKVSASAQIIYHYSISPESISGIVIYIFSHEGAVGWLEILTNMYTYDGIINSTLML